MILTNLFHRIIKELMKYLLRKEQAVVFYKPKTLVP